MKRYLMLVAGVIVSLTGLCQAYLAGPWSGELKIGSNSLPLVINFNDSDGGLDVTIDSPAQGATGIPAELVCHDDTIKVAVPSIGAKYIGTYDGNKISGTFSQSGMAFPLTLNRGLPQRPQTPMPPFAYQTREVIIANPDYGAHLAGTLTLPVGYMLRRHAEYPAVVMVTGSGLQNRDEEIYRHKPFAVLAHHLALHGIASLRYDDRGCGASTGEVSGATTATFAEDASAAVKYLRDSVACIGSVGVLGHSEGGTIAYMLAADGVADFVVSMAGPAVTGKEILLEQNRRLFAPTFGEDVADDYVSALGMVIDFMEENPDAKEWSGLDAATAGLSHLTKEMKENLQLIISTRNPWIDYFVRYNPTDGIANIQCPVMALGGTLDTQVDSKINAESLKRWLNPNVKAEIKTYEGLNHLFQHAKTGMPSEYSVIEETISPEVIDDIIAWIQSLQKP